MICVICQNEHTNPGEYCQACLAAYRLRAGGNQVPFLRQQLKGENVRLAHAIKAKKATQQFRETVKRLESEIAVQLAERMR